MERFKKDACSLVAATRPTRIIERIWKRTGTLKAEAEGTKVAEASAPCWMRRRWSAAVPHRDKARSSGHARKQIEKIRQSQNAVSV
jgi:hypothetical protein